MMTIHIEALTFDAIIGILDFEREHPQRVVVDLQLSYDYSENAFIDYADLCDMIETKIKTERYRLLEEALADLEALLIADYPHIESLSLKIAKPDIITNATVALSAQWHY